MPRPVRASGWPRAAAVVLASCLALLAGCGGGSSSGGGDTPAPGSTQGGLTLGLAGGAPGSYRHVWVTVDSVALNVDPDRAWSPTDPTWQVLKLDAPKVVDLNASVNGVIASLLTGRSLPAATYGQLRLFVLRHDQTLVDAAAQQHLLYNAQVETVDAAGVAHELPLEMPDGALGVRMPGPLAIAANVDNEITLQWDAEHSLVRFSGDDGIDRITLRPDLRAYDIAQTGAIIGFVDQSLFCAAGQTTGCIDDVVASAERPSADGRFMVSVRSTPVVRGSAHASFALYPLPALPAGATFDVVIRGRHMRTMVVRGVPAVPADLLAATPQQLGVDRTDPDHPVAAPMVPVYSAQGLVSLAAPTVPVAAQVRFGQTPPGAGALPHEVAVAHTDPFTGLFTQPVSVPTGGLRVADYPSNGMPAFADVAPQEGVDTLSVMTLGTPYDDASAIATLVAPAGASVSLTAPVAPRRSGLDQATLTVTLNGSASKYDAAELVVADAGGIVTTRDVSSLLGVVGAQATLALPAGSAASTLGATAVYAVSVRAWKRSSPATSVQWVRATPVVDLRSASAASVTLTLP